jgi:cell division protein FtsQ
MARRAAAESGKAARSKSPRILLWSVVGLLAATALVLVAMKVEQFLISDPRFLLARHSDFNVTGNYYTSEKQIEGVFGRDFGRSVYLCPISQRRQQLLAIDWVEEATVSRIWPNRILVAVRERKPVAFVQVESRDGAMAPMLIDGEGVLLRPPQGVRLKVPVLAGVRLADTPETRKQRVERLMVLQRELGPMMDKISEVDVADLDNLKVTQQFDGKAVVLMLGSQKFESRMRNLINNFSEIRKRMPNATVLDLRLPDRVIAVSEQAAAEGGQR